MVLLTMTAALVVAVKDFNATISSHDQNKTLDSDEPSLADPMIGNPISHSQILDIARALKAAPMTHDVRDSEEAHQTPYNLDSLLRGSHIYIPPPPPKPETVSSPASPPSPTPTHSQSHRHKPTKI